MQPVYITGNNIISSLGFTSQENFQNMVNGTIGIVPVSDDSLAPLTLPLSRVDTARLNSRFTEMVPILKKGFESVPFTRLEKMMILSIADAMKQSGISAGNRRVLPVISTTKGNINLLEEKFRLIFPHKRLFLWELARVIQALFGFENTPVIISNACISGVLAIMHGARAIRNGQYDHVVVCGGDILSEFVISGFLSFQSLSSTPCRPYDILRNGLSLGEAAGTVILSSSKPDKAPAFITVGGGSVTNDANHISGPSRTGEELALAIKTSIKESGLEPSDISFISAHGTATPFNDEMESKAISMSGLSETPVNSFKGYWGHTLGAAGVIETVASAHMLKTGMLIRSAGFETPGVPEHINVISATVAANLTNCVKTASGFGGCNAAINLNRE